MMQCNLSTGAVQFHNEQEVYYGIRRCLNTKHEERHEMKINIENMPMKELQLADMSDSQWVTAFQNSAKNLLGRTADEIVSYDATTIEELFQSPLFKLYKLHVQTTTETFHGEQRREVHIVSLNSLNYEEYGNHLISEIEQLAEELKLRKLR